jgi:hypothetical protein
MTEVARAREATTDRTRSSVRICASFMSITIDPIRLPAPGGSP